MEWTIDYQKNMTTFKHTDVGINVPIGIYGASRGGGPWWFVAGIVVGTVSNAVISSFELSQYIKEGVGGTVGLLYGYGPTYICNNGFPNV